LLLRKRLNGALFHAGVGLMFLRGRNSANQERDQNSEHDLFLS
jgi:hypothetical protein